MELGGVEKKVYGALILLSDKNLEVKVSLTDLAKRMGYKRPGGAISFALKSLEYQNQIAVLGKNHYKVMM